MRHSDTTQQEVRVHDRTCPDYDRHDLVKVACASDEPEAELLQGLRRNASVGSVVRRALGLTCRSSSPLVRGGCSSPHSTSGSPETFCAKLTRVGPSHCRRPAETDRRELLAGPLVAVALIGFVVCRATDVIA